MKHILFLIALFAAYSSYGQQVKYTSPGKDFFAIFPKEPTLTSDVTKLPSGNSTTSYTYMADPSDDEAYLVSSMDMLLSIEEVEITPSLLEKARDRIIKSADGTNVKTLSMDTKSKQPSISFTYKIDNVQARADIYLKKSIQYCVMSLYTIDGHEPAAVKVFHDSFKLLD